MLAPLYGGGFRVAMGQLVIFYYNAAILLHYIVPRFLPVQNIQKHERKPKDVQRDALQSLGPLAVKALVWVAVEHVHARGWGFTYDGPVTTPAQIAYLVLCVVLLDYLHDTWFYWTHRLLHWKPLYQHVHFMHHTSSAPTAFTGYSFHVVEAVIVFANELIVCFLFPVHMGLHRAYHIFTTIIHEGGHAGYEISPFQPHLSNLLMTALKGLSHNFGGFNTVQHHDMHHRYPSKHFSLYFTHWDRLCGTLHPAYDDSVFTYFQ